MHGWINLDKPYGMSSAKAVAIVKRLTGAKKAGHAGTLDPLATGVLPIALGEATKTVSYAMEDEKSYQFTVTWGEQRDTDDAEGQVIATSPVRPAREQIEAVLPKFIGEISQIPPIFSALKQGGKRACDRARDGEEVVMQPRQITIHRLICLESQENTARFEVDCGKGTYIRSLARDMAQDLGTCGYVSELRRIVVGKFSEKHIISLDKLEEIVHDASPERVMLPVDTVLDDIPVLVVNPEHSIALRYGQTIPVTGNTWPEGAVGVVKTTTTLVALAEREGNAIRPVRVFNLE